MQKKRCGWVKLSDEIYVNYHDNEWGKPLFDEQKLFELFSLETQAAGLSWLTVLKKRDNYKKAFANFDLKTVSNFTCKEIDEVLSNYDVIKNRPKLDAIVNNAKLFLDIQKEFGSIKNYFWEKVGNKQIKNSVSYFRDAPTTSKLSDDITKDLKKRGFKFVGSVTIYSFLQAAGLIDDHENDCFCKS
ncbi:MAG: DNA-3-methyladenine glycosylase I [Campylobacteraceae bacterium]